MTDAQPQEILASIERMREIARQRESAEIIQLPLWPEPKRGTPNSFIRSALFSAIQSKDRQFIDGKTLDSQAGITIKYTGQQLNQEDLTLWETLVHLAKGHPLGNVCSFTAHGLLKAMGLNTGGDEHARLHKGITRLIACAVEITHEGRIYTGSLLEGSTKDEITTRYVVRLHRELIRLYGETQWTAIDWQQRLNLRRKPLAQALHAYYSSHRMPHPVKLSTLQRYTGSRNQQAAGFKVKLRAALDELVKLAFLQSYSIEGDTVAVRRTPALPRGGD
ncbi:TrfA family protein [Candidatus Accumulibacter phosphatis]|jgi:hypothetical protein|uniref:TrfA family protein n=2 Tax=Candidatus Accumulibacter phosphatis TaxID=327160 RepID=A0ABX1U4Q3_9PROT|nr:plasmid replication initiator TrfA [Candidatus Accumulibacter phosphatis]NMQ30154.1 TrfA family protein [Candidatus Accumulibacter phosphatis]